MFGWWRCAASLASVANDATTSGCSRRCGSKRLSATRLRKPPADSDSARCTEAIPPLPSSSYTTYVPNFSGSVTETNVLLRRHAQGAVEPDRLSIEISVLDDRGDQLGIFRRRAEPLREHDVARQRRADIFLERAEHRRIEDARRCLLYTSPSPRDGLL